MDVRHDSFMDAAYLKLARKYKVATVYTDSDKYPSFADLTGDFAYARLMQSSPDNRAGYAPEALQAWAARAHAWAAGGQPDDLPCIEAAKGKARAKGRDVFIFFINGHKEKGARRGAGAAGKIGEVN